MASDMKDGQPLGGLIEMFVNQVSHPRGRTLTLMHEACVTVPQLILLNFTLAIADSTPSSLAATMKISRPSVSQMIERLAKLGYVRRTEDPRDRRCKTIAATPKARRLLWRLKTVRAAEYSAGTAGLSSTTRRLLSEALVQALAELAAAGGRGAA
jgi:DNA-binding MarR family transcriptional regulator